MNAIVLTRIASVILGLLYLASGISKAMDINGFADVIARYGIPRLRMFAPFIIGLEITLGIGLLFEVYRQRAGLLSLGLLITLTLIFAFGYIFLNISDCGCFGDVISMSPTVALFRNILMIALSFCIWRQPESQTSKAILKTFFAVILGIITFVMTGFEMKNTYVEISVHEGMNLNNTFMRPFISLNKDQLFFVFSPACPHCQQVTPTINTYTETESVDEVVGMYPHTVSAESLREYRKKLTPNFRTIAVTKESLHSVTHTLPTILLIRKGYVVKIYMDNIPGPHQIVASYNENSLMGNRASQLPSVFRYFSSIK
ncbi:hypothetical protein EXU85_29310 [Spirosoma sp. KCTC 42546]|uniref:DoxX family protein n=1 Tax=Spirosoma sp. KCTC 42546 TaxID=2520506 RepID=UPI0011572822|nr:MauE/DoxX family redox-associated membrane protein [Spirosoma sp. KCTC 42546]QDK82484.1 hypothetical protein EXU85_29310 [Spirosoma sp. KCTC 42546]